MNRTLLESEFDDMGLSISDDIIDECKYNKNMTYTLGIHYFKTRHSIIIVVLK